MISQKVKQKKIIKGSIEIPVECYSRVVGYFRAVRAWNNGKQSEFENRKEYDVNKRGVSDEE